MLKLLTRLLAFLVQALPVMARAGVVPEDAFHDKANRSLTFATTREDMRLIRVRELCAPPPRRVELLRRHGREVRRGGPVGAAACARPARRERRSRR